MTLRIGIWIVALAVGVELIAAAAAMGAFGVFQVVHGPLVVPWPLEALRLAGLVTQVVVVAGLVACTLGAAPAQRPWFAIAMIAGVAPPLGFLLGPGSGLLHWLQAGVVVSACCFARACTTLTSRRLVHALYGVAALSAVAFVLGPYRGWISTVESVVGFALLLVWCFVAFQELGGFPEVGDAPTARVASRARSAVSYASLAFCLGGLGLLAVAVWQNDVAGTVHDRELVFVGIGTFIGAATALRRTRTERTTIRRPVIVALVLAVASLVVLDERRARPEHVRLAAHEVPGLRIALPAGRTEASSTDRARGELVVRPTHSLLGPTTLSWRTGPRPRSESFTPKRRGERAIDERTVLHLGFLKVAARWECSAARWFELELAIEEPTPFNDTVRTAQLDHLLGRILATFACTRE